MKTKYLWIILLICIALVSGAKMFFSPLRPGFQLTSFDQIAKAVPGGGPHHYGASRSGFRDYEIYQAKASETHAHNVAAIRAQVFNQGYYYQP